MKDSNERGAVGTFIVAAWGGFLGGMAFLALSHTALFAPDWCDGSTQCVREWVAALSGWVAAAIASATVFVLIATLKQMQKASQIQSQAYVFVSKASFGQFNNVVVYCKNGGITPATRFAVNGDVSIVNRGEVTNSIRFRDDGFKIWSTLGPQEELSVGLDVDAKIVKRFLAGENGRDELLLLTGQVIYCTVENHDHITQFAFYVEPSSTGRFRRPTANIKSFWRTPISMGQ